MAILKSDRYQIHKLDNEIYETILHEYEIQILSLRSD